MLEFILAALTFACVMRGLACGLVVFSGILFVRSYQLVAEGQSF